MLALGVVFLIEYLDDTIKTPDDMQRELALPTLGTISHLVPVKTPIDSLVTFERPSSPISEACRFLRTNMRFLTVLTTRRVRFWSPAPPPSLHKLQEGDYLEPRFLGHLIGEVLDVAPDQVVRAWPPPAAVRMGAPEELMMTSQCFFSSSERSQTISGGALLRSRDKAGSTPGFFSLVASTSLCKTSMERRGPR